MLKYNVKIQMLKYDVEKILKYLGKHKISDGKKRKKEKKPDQKKTSVDLKWTAKAVHKKSFEMMNKKFIGREAQNVGQKKTKKNLIYYDDNDEKNH